MDNRLFNVNGKTEQQLKLAIELALLNEYGDNVKIISYYYCSKKGLVLCDKEYSNNYIDYNKFTNRMGVETPVNSDELFEIVLDYLKSEHAKNIETEEWEDDIDFDGSTSLGWRLYTEDWGSIDGYNGSYLAVKPVYLWYGK